MQKRKLKTKINHKLLIDNMADSDLLKQRIREEYLKCAYDPVYFMRHYCKLSHPIKGSILFDLYPFQEKVLQDFKDHDFNIVLKSRQMGISTLCAAYALWVMIFSTDKNILVIATKQLVAKALVDKVRVMYKFLPSWMKIQCVEDNHLSLKFINGSQIRAVASSPDAGRGQACSLTIFDEAAFIDDIDEIWTAASPTLSTGGRAILLSSPNGCGNFFHKKWIEAEEKQKDETGKTFNTIKLKWDLHPERNQAWRDEQTKVLGEKMARQEFDADFLTTGNSVVDIDILNWYKETQIKEPVERRGSDRNYWIWEYPDPTKQYAISADVARGDGADFSAAQVIEIETLKQVAEYKGKIDTEQYARLLIEMAISYNNALLVVENASIGWSTIQSIINMGYPNLFYMEQDLKVVDTKNHINNKYNTNKGTPGFTTSSRTRPLITANLEAYMRNKEVIVQSIRLIDELYTFIWKNGKAQAMDGYNDDVVMSFAIGLWIRDTALRLKNEGNLLQKSVLGGMAKLGTQSTVSSKYMITNNSVPKLDPYSMKVGNQDMNLRWLL